MVTDKVGIVTTLDGAPMPGGRWPAPIGRGPQELPESAQRFIDNGGCRGLQEQVLLSGQWNLNPWFVAGRSSTT